MHRAVALVSMFVALASVAHAGARVGRTDVHAQMMPPIIVTPPPPAATQPGRAP